MAWREETVSTPYSTESANYEATNEAKEIVESYLLRLLRLSLSFVQLADHDVVAELEGQVSVPRFPHLRQ